MIDELAALISKFAAIQRGEAPLTKNESPNEFLKRELDEFAPIKWMSSSMISHGTGSGGQTGEGYAAFVVSDMLAKGYDPSFIAASLIDALTKNSFTYFDTYAVSGVTVEGRCDIADGIYLLPNESLPYGLYVEHMFTDFSFPRFGGNGEYRRSQDAALVIEKTVTPAITEVARDDRAKAETMEDDRYALVERIALSISLALGGYVEIKRRTWLYSKDCIFGRNGGMFIGGFSRKPTGPHRMMKSGTASKEYLDQIYNMQSAKSLELAIKRLVKSRSLSTIEDQVVDLGMAAEIALMHEDRGEITSRLAMRAAFLLGQDGHERTAVHNSMRDLYRARSDTVHSGETPVKYRRRLAEWDALLDRLLKALLQRGDFPDWNRLILG